MQDVFFCYNFGRNGIYMWAVVRRGIVLHVFMSFMFVCEGRVA